MTPSQGPPLSLRPFPVADTAPKNLAEFIARVNTQPGGFRVVTEQKLRDEIRSRDAPPAAPDSDPDPEDVDLSDAGNNDDDQAKDAGLVRMEVLKNIEIAGNTAMLTLDSLSLLLSKQSPTQASLTLSQQLRDMVGIGTLGADRLDEPIAKANKAADEEEVAVGLTLMHINQARDAADEAGRFLQREVEAEARYWEDVVAVKQSGWAICRVPNERHTLGVRFGFSEAAAEFKNNGLAPMKRGHDGSVELDLGRLGGVSEGLVVTYEKDGRVVGRAVPRQGGRGDGVSLEARVLEARNTIFSQELWHELTREARTLAGYDVKPRGSSITYRVDERSTMTVELVALDACPAADASLPDNKVAEMARLSLHMLLSYAHRHNEVMRMRPLPPHVSRTRGQQVYALIRPVVARMTFARSLRACTAQVGRVAAALRRAGFASSFVLKTTPYSVADPAAQGSNRMPAASMSLVRNIIQPIEFNIVWSILPDAPPLTIRCRTFLFPVTTSIYQVLLPPSSPLHRLCAPFPDGYVDTEALFDYLATAVARLLASHFQARLCGPDDHPPAARWIQPPHSASIHRPSADDHDHDDDHDDHNPREVRFALALEPVALLVSSVVSPADDPASTSWKWTPGDDAESRTMEDVLACCAAEG